MMLSKKAQCGFLLIGAEPVTARFREISWPHS